VPAQHPGLLTDVMWFGWMALDLGDLPFAEACARYAYEGRVALYASSSRYVQEMRQLRGAIAMAKQDGAGALAEFAAILAPAPEFDRASSTQRSVARAWLDVLAATSSMVAADAIHTPLTLDLDAGDRSFRATEMRLAAALGALLRGERESAQGWRNAAEASGGLANAPHWQPLARLIDLRLKQMQDPAYAAEDALAGIESMLAQQQRRLFDPTAKRWLGPPPPRQAEWVARMRALAERIGEVRKQPF